MNIHSDHFDYTIIGAGIIGMTLAYELKQRNPEFKIAIIEKEADVAFHASGRNSGVLHAGFYYDSDSLKAKFCVEGNQLMKKFCQQKNIFVNNCQKVVVAKNEDELKALKNLDARGQKNNVEVRLIDENELNQIDPNAKTYKWALLSPTTASVDPIKVCLELKKDLISKSVRFFFNNSFLEKKGPVLQCSSVSLKSKYLVNCAGAYADKIAKKFNIGHNYTLIPFKGLYLKYSGDSQVIKTNIYPLPHPKAPFLGVHFTLTSNNQIKIGPTAIPALWREHYNGFDNFDPIEMFDILKHQVRLFIYNKFQFRTLAIEELKKYWPSNFRSMAKELVKQIDVQNFNQWIRPGIRAQLLDLKTDQLVQDFVIEQTDDSLHVLNSVSPAFTCSFSFAKHLANLIEKSI